MMHATRAVAIAAALVGADAFAQLPPGNTGGFYVSDYVDDEIAIYDAAGTYLRSFTAEGLDGPRGIVIEADGKAGVVDEVQYRNVEEITESEVTGDLVAAVGGECTAVAVTRVRRNDAHDVATTASEPGHLIGPPVGTDLEERVRIDNERDGASNVERRRAISRNESEQFVDPVDPPVGPRHDRCCVVHARRKIGQKAPGLRNGVLLVLCQVVDRAVPAVDVPTSEFLFRDVLPGGLDHDGRAGDEELCCLAQHHRKVAEYRLRRAETDHAAEQHVDDRYGLELLGVHGRTQMSGQERASGTGDPRFAGIDRPRALLGSARSCPLLRGNHRCNAATTGGAVEQTNGRKAQVECQAVEMHGFRADRAIGVAAS